MSQEPVCVYRVQDGEGRGPFRPGFSHLWVEERADHANLRPWFEEFGRGAIPSPEDLQSAYYGCGCRTLDQLRRWFTESEYARLRHFGYHAVQLDVERVLHESKTQLLFRRGRSLHLGVTCVPLYASIGLILPFPPHPSPFTAAEQP